MKNDNLSRRCYLRIVSGAGAGTLAGCSALGRDSSETTRQAKAARPAELTTGATTAPTAAEPVDPNQFETVVDVADAGADASGETSINSVLDDHLGDDTLLRFPSGRYRLDPWRVVGYRNLAVVGEDATLVPPPDVNYWLMWGNLEDFRFGGFTIDCREKDVAPVTYLSVTGGTNLVRNVTVRGHRRASTTAFEIAAADPDADLRLENVSLPDGSTRGHAVYVFPKSVGRLTFRNCRVENWWEGLYAAYHSGPLRILGGYYANNGIEQVRVGGGKAGAVVRDVTVRVDDPKEPEQKQNMRGIWAEEGGHVRIENCDVAILDSADNPSSGGIVVGKQFGRAVVEDTEIRVGVDRPVPAIRIRRPIQSMAGQTMPSMGSLPDQWRFTGRNLKISGPATSGSAIHATRRDDCRFEKLCIQHPKGSRNGISIAHSRGCEVRDSTIDVSGETITTDDAKVKTTQVQTDGDC